MNLRRRWLLVGAVVVALAVVSFVYIIRVAHDGRQPLVVPSPPSACELTPHPVYFYTNNPVDAGKAGDMSTYKESPQALGPSAVPYNYDAREPQAMLYLVQKQYLFRLCGDTTNGPDPQLLKLGYGELDVLHTGKMGPYDEDPNVPIVSEQHGTYLSTYLKALSWAHSQVVYLPKQHNVWMVAATDEHVGGSLAPRLKAVQGDLPAGPYLELAVVQPDGAYHIVCLWLAAGFATVYFRADDVPESLKI